jgi:predicted transcriptional regulator
MSERMRDLTNGVAVGMLIGAFVFLGMATFYAPNDPLAAKGAGAIAGMLFFVGLGLLAMVLGYERTNAAQIANGEDFTDLSVVAHELARSERRDAIAFGYLDAKVNAAVLPIRPRHAHALLSGAKTVELRRAALRADTTHVVIYETAPTSAIVGVVAVEAQTHGLVPKLAAQFARAARLSSCEAIEYLTGARNATAIHVQWPVTYAAPIPVQSLGWASAPQSVRYLTTLEAQALCLAAERAQKNNSAQEESA